MEAMNKLTRDVVRWNGWALYAVAVALPWLPILLARAFGMDQNAFVSDANAPRKLVECIGYWHRPNWTSLVVLLPAALVLFRWTANRLYPLDFWPNSYRVCDRPIIHQTAALARVATDGRNLLAALSVTVLIHVVDLAAIAHAYYLGPQAKRPSDWDWARWFLLRPADAALRNRNLVLVVVAYTSQFALVLLAMMLIILLLRHNLFYLRLIYLRSRVPTQQEDESIVLDFEDQDLRFGLLPLSDQFNTQIKLLAIVGSFSLLSRIVFSDVNGLRTYLATKAIADPTKIFWEAFGKVVEYRHALFPTPGQVLFPICWVIMFAVVLLPARAKLLPLKVRRGPRGGALKYLLELLPANSKIDIETQSLTKPGSVDEVAKIFARHSFWPVGDTTAQFYALVAFFVFFFIVTPVLPSRSVVLGVVIYYSLLLVMSYVCSKFLFWLFEFRIKAVDPRLASAAQTDKS